MANRKKKQKRVYQQKMWDAAKIYCGEAEKAYKARAYFCALVALGCELEALLRIFDFVQTTRRKDRCRDFYGLINRAFKQHWIPHDVLSWWKKTHGSPLKPWLHEIREARNGVHAHLFQKDLFTRQVVSNVTYVVHEMYTAIEMRNSRNLMEHLYQSGNVTAGEYRKWKKRDSEKRNSWTGRSKS